MLRSMAPRTKMIVLVVAVFALVVFGWWYVEFHRTPPSAKSTTENSPIAQVSFVCDAGKTINASFYQDESKAASSADQPPVPGGSVSIVLSDGRTMTLPQTISADGTRYASADGSFIFWAKGNGAFITESNQQTYSGCIEVVSDPGGLPQVYENSTEGFSLRYPAGYTVDSTYQYQELGPGNSINGVKFTIPSTMRGNTNLGSDTYISVEEIPQTTSCVATLFLDDPRATITTLTDQGVQYSVASSTGAGAGNRYAETVYAIPGTNPCVAVRYFVHYSVLDNYPPGTVTAFDQNALLSQFDAIRRTLVVNE